MMVQSACHTAGAFILSSCLILKWGIAIEVQTMGLWNRGSVALHEVYVHYSSVGR